MPVEAITFRAESEFIGDIRERAKQLGVSVNVTIGNMLAPVLGRTRGTPSTTRPRNDLMRFCGCLKDVDAEAMRKAQKVFETIDEEMWIRPHLPRTQGEKHPDSAKRHADRGICLGTCRDAPFARHPLFRNTHAQMDRRSHPMKNTSLLTVAFALAALANQSFANPSPVFQEGENVTEAMPLLAQATQRGGLAFGGAEIDVVAFAPGWSGYPIKADWSKTGEGSRSF